MALTVEGFIEQFRLDTDDPELGGSDEDSLWSNDEIIRYVNLAQRAFAKESEVLLDRTTVVVTQYIVNALNSDVALNPLVIKIRRAKLLTTKRLIAIKTLEQVDSEFSSACDYGSTQTGSADWEDIVGTPEIGITNLEANVLRLVPIPALDDNLSLVVVRYPLVEILSDTDTLEIIDDKSQLAMLDYMKYLGYQKHDADIHSNNIADNFLANFKMKVNEVKHEFVRKHKPTGTVRYGGL